ncbi:PspC domain-containing protein [Bacillus sp. FJAT-50079]|nr:PspC domain-containing protein [Bacillus sp. FJAT-50079]MBS4207427.1 PspC domain-containing protein [Bacillus sp. FJAT-50079]
MLQKLTKSSTDKALLGICGGIANLFGISSFIVRLIFIFTSSVSIWVYLFLAWELRDKPSL